LKDLRVDAEAEAELLAAASWYLERGGPPLRARLLDDSARILEDVRRWPKRFAALLRPEVHPPVRRARLRRFPYAVVFLELETEIRVLAFAHLRRRPLYWRSRPGP
jgi:plasmid stabilization system protein ParE